MLCQYLGFDPAPETDPFTTSYALWWRDPKDKREVLPSRRPTEILVKPLVVRAYLQHTVLCCHVQLKAGIKLDDATSSRLSFYSCRRGRRQGKPEGSARRGFRGQELYKYPRRLVAFAPTRMRCSWRRPHTTRC